MSNRPHQWNKHMFAVIFVVQPKKERWDEYLGLAKQLKPKLEAIDGYIANERFKGVGDGSKLLSLSIWRDEKSVIRWRTHGEHHDVQKKGRFEVFEDYHLRVGEIVSDSDQPPGIAEQRRFDETEVGAAKAVTVTELTPVAGSTTRTSALAADLGLEPAAEDPAKDLIEQEAYESICTPGKFVLLACWRNAQAAQRWQPRASGAIRAFRHRQVRVIRDYGMFERREAPQFYADVRRGP
jgi:heme-degrading monooxygenase HmoA